MSDSVPVPVPVPVPVSVSVADAVLISVVDSAAPVPDIISIRLSTCSTPSDEYSFRAGVCAALIADDVIDAVAEADALITLATGAASDGASADCTAGFVAICESAVNAGPLLAAAT